MTGRKLLLLFVFLTGCGNRFIVHVVAQNGAPVQIVSIAPEGNNLLAHVRVRNTTDQAVQDFMLMGAIIRCVDGRSILRQALSARAAARASGTLPPGSTSGSRPLLPHEETEITTLSLARDKLEKVVKENGKLRVQVGVAYVNFQPSENVFTQSAPDWHDPRFDQGVPDAADAAHCSRQ